MRPLGQLHAVTLGLSNECLGYLAIFVLASSWISLNLWMQRESLALSQNRTSNWIGIGLLLLFGMGLLATAVQAESGELQAFRERIGPVQKTAIITAIILWWVWGEGLALTRDGALGFNRKGLWAIEASLVTLASATAFAAMHCYIEPLVLDNIVLFGCAMLIQGVLGLITFSFGLCTLDLVLSAEPI